MKQTKVWLCRNPAEPLGWRALVGGPGKVINREATSLLEDEDDDETESGPTGQRSSACKLEFLE